MYPAIPINSSAEGALLRLQNAGYSLIFLRTKLPSVFGEGTDIKAEDYSVKS